MFVEITSFNSSFSVWMCEQCTRFRSGSGLLVRAFECEGSWAQMPPSSILPPDNALHLPIERFGPGHGSSFYPPAYGASLLALASSNSSSEHVNRFNECARREVFPTILHDGPWVGSPGTRPTSLLQESNTNVEYATYANSFGFTLRGSTRVVGAHAFDAWTTKPRPLCKDEGQQAALRLDAVRRFCDNVVSTSVSKPCSEAHHCRPRLVQPRSGRIKLNSSRLEQWPAHVALGRIVAGSDANCRFKTIPSMLHQQEVYRLMLHASGLLMRCPYAWYAGAISQVAAVYDMRDVTGIFVLDWVPSHLPLAMLAFKSLLPLQLAQPLQLVRLSYARVTGQDHRNKEHVEHGQVSCSCHELSWK